MSLFVPRPARSGEAISDDSLCQPVSSLTAQGLLHILGSQAEMGGLVPSVRRGTMYSELPRWILKSLLWPTNYESLWATLYTGQAKPGYPEELLCRTQCEHCPSHFPVGGSLCASEKKIGVRSVDTCLKPCTATSPDKITLKTSPLSHFNDIQGQESKG